MRLSLMTTCVLATGVAIVGMTSRMIAKPPHRDFGTFIADQLSEHSDHSSASSIRSRKARSAPTTERITAGHPGRRPVCTCRSYPAASHRRPTRSRCGPTTIIPSILFVCDEETTNPAVQRVDLSKPAAATRRQSSRASSPAIRCDGHPGAPSSSPRKLRRPSMAPPSRRAASTRLSIR